MRTGRVEEQVEDILVIIDSSIAEVFVNGGETVFTTRIYLDKQRKTTCNRRQMPDSCDLTAAEI